jgi:hypothetical protein
VVVDSAGNEQSYEKSIVVDNEGDQGGDGGGGRDNGDDRGSRGGGSSGGGGSGGGSGGDGGASGGGSAGGGTGAPVANPAQSGVLGDRVTLTRSRRAVRNGQGITFGGRVVDGGVPSANTLVALQARVGRRWVTFAVVRTDPLGNYTSRYRFTRTRRSTRYRFRAHVDAQGTVGTLDSGPQSVRVRPGRR